jgi:hypothetical protein
MQLLATTVRGQAWCHAPEERCHVQANAGNDQQEREVGASSGSQAKHEVHLRVGVAAILGHGGAMTLLGPGMAMALLIPGPGPGHARQRGVMAQDRRNKSAATGLTLAACHVS